MELKLVLLIGSTLLMLSCGSNKKVVSKRVPPRKKVVLVRNPIPERNKEVDQLQVEKKRTVPTPKNTEEYISSFATIAMREMREYKIPASITLAQGILESGSGRSHLAIRSNNHFGIKCHKGWKGKSVTHDDDKKGECFRKYKHPETSYEDHSKFLTSRKRYAKLFKLRRTDYKGWAYGLKRAGYATDSRYPHKLIALIKKYNLDVYDKKALEGTNIKTTKRNSGITTKKSGTIYHKVVKGDTLYSLSRKYSITVAKLKKANAMVNNSLSIGQQLRVK